MANYFQQVKKKKDKTDIRGTLMDVNYPDDKGNMAEVVGELPASPPKWSYFIASCILVSLHPLFQYLTTMIPYIKLNIEDHHVQVLTMPCQAKEEASWYVCSMHCTNG